MVVPNNLLANIPAVLPGELVETLLEAPALRIERIVSLGHVSPAGEWFDQEASEWVLLLTGSATLTFEGEGPLDLRPGSFVHIPAHTRHRVERTDAAHPTVWLAVHYGDRA